MAIGVSDFWLASVSASSAASSASASLDLLRSAAAWVARSGCEACVIAAGVLLVQRLLRGRVSARWRYNLWLLVVARLVLPALPASRISPFNLMPAWGRGSQAAAEGSTGRLSQYALSISAPPAAPSMGMGTAPAAPPEDEIFAAPAQPARPATNRLSAPATAESVGRGVAAPVIEPSAGRGGVGKGAEPFPPAPRLVPVPQPPQPPLELPAPPVRPPVVESVAASSSSQSSPADEGSSGIFAPAVIAAESRQAPPPSARASVAAWLKRNGTSALALLWAAGVAWAVGRLLRASLRLRLAVRGLPPVQNPDVLRLLDACCREMGVERRPELLWVDGPCGPALVGFWRPRIVLPACAQQQLTSDELRGILRHELAHLKRHDVAGNWLLALLQAVHWYNPVLHLAFARIRADRELACDEMALSATPRDRRRHYAPTLLKLLELFSPDPAGALPRGSVGILETNQGKRSVSQLNRRLIMIVRFDQDRRDRQRFGRGPLAGIALSLLLGGVALTGPVSAQDHPAPESPAAPGELPAATTPPPATPAAQTESVAPQSPPGAIPTTPAATPPPPTPAAGVGIFAPSAPPAPGTPVPARPAPAPRAPAGGAPGMGMAIQALPPQPSKADKAAINAAKADVAAADAELKFRNDEVQRLRQLNRNGAVSSSELGQAEASLARSKAMVAAARAKLTAVEAHAQEAASRTPAGPAGFTGIAAIPATPGYPAPGSAPGTTGTASAGYPPMVGVGGTAAPGYPAPAGRPGATGTGAVMGRGRAGMGPAIPAAPGYPMRPGSPLPGLAAEAGPQPSGMVEDAEARKADENAWQGLRKPVKVQFDDTSLPDALSYLQDATGVDFVYDEKTVRDSGIDGDGKTKVTLRLNKSAPAEQVLRWVLRSAAGDSLSFALDHGVVLVSLKDRIDKTIITRVYDVGDLERSVQPGQPGLVDLIRQFVASDSWSTNGGTVGNIRAFEDRLLITQTEPNHREIENLLTLLRNRSVPNGVRGSHTIGEPRNNGFGDEPATSIETAPGVAPRLAPAPSLDAVPAPATTPLLPTPRFGPMPVPPAPRSIELTPRLGPGPAPAPMPLLPTPELAPKVQPPAPAPEPVPALVQPTPAPAPEPAPAPAPAPEPPTPSAPAPVPAPAPAVGS